MERILKFFNKEYGNINQAAVLLGLFAFLAQILGLFRDRFIAQIIGPSLELDSYYTAFRIPDFIFITIATLASVTVLIPFVLNKMKDGKMTEEANTFLSNIFILFFLALSCVSLILFFLMPYLVTKIAPGFDTFYQGEVVKLSRIMLLSPILLGLSNLISSLTQIFQRFFIYALSPIFYNAGIIIGVLVFYKKMGISGLALGVVLGAFMHFLIQFLASLNTGFKFKITYKFNFQEFKKIIFISFPRTLGLAFNNIALLVIISSASFLTEGSISVFNLSLNLQSVPLGIIGLSYAVASFPALTKSYSLGHISEFKSYLKSSTKSIVFWSMPVIFLFIVLRAQIVRVILGSVDFSWENTRLVAASLAIFAISFVSQSLIALFARAYYATGNTKTPLYINLFSSVCIILCSQFFIFMFNQSSFFKENFEFLLKVKDLHGTEVLMLPLAYSLGTILNSFFLWFSLKKDFFKKESLASKTLFQTLVASFVMGIVAYFSLNYFALFFNMNTFWGIFLQGFLSGILGIILGVIVLYLFQNEELFVLYKTIHSKFWKAKIIKNTESDIA